jgi:enamine deaminase RidA (YjgF/YER057c/UK114 family)
LVFICGQVGEGPTVIEQTASALKSVDDALALAGTDKSKILEATVWLSDMKYYDQFNSIYDKWVVPGKPPCRACLESKLASPKYLVEVRVIAAK